MFERLFKKECICCGIKIPKNFKPISSDYERYCSVECSKLDDEVGEIIFDKYGHVRKHDDYSHYELKAQENLRQLIHENRKKMEQYFGNNV